MSDKLLSRYQLTVEKTTAGTTRLFLFDTWSGQLWLSSNLAEAKTPGDDTLRWVKLNIPRELSSDEIHDKKAALPKPAPLWKAERTAIIQALQETGGNKMEAAKRLGIGRQTLYNKMHDYKVQWRTSAPAP